MTRKVDHNSWLDRLRPLSRNPEPAPAPSAPSYPIPPGRRDRATLSTWQDVGAVKELKRLSVDVNKSQQELVAEALNLLFAKYDRPQVAR
jgi:hypothetical protein